MRTIFRFFLLLTASMACVPAQTASRASWENVGSLTRQDRLDVFRKDSKLVTGLFESSTESGLTVVRRNNQVLIPREEIARVYVHRKGKRWKGALIGLAVGFGIGFAIGAPMAGFILDKNNPSFTDKVGMGSGFGLFTGGIGAGVGALAGGSSRVLVYRAK